MRSYRFVTNTVRELKLNKTRSWEDASDVDRTTYERAVGVIYSRADTQDRAPVAIYTSNFNLVWTKRAPNS